MTTSDSHPVLTATVDGLATLTLNRPDRRNAIAPQTWPHISRFLDELTAQGQARVLVIAGAGSAFCAGADLSGSRVDSEAERSNLHFMREVGKVIEQLHQLPIPTVAKVQGPAFGAGFNLALACDLIIASEQARFSQVFLRAGLAVDSGGSWLLPRMIGMHRAKELILLAREISAAEAHTIGLVTQVVEPDMLDSAVAATVATLKSAPPIALSLTKGMINESFELGLHQALEAEARSQTVVVNTQDGAEALSAFQQKRPAVYVGR
jgi:enoyl-CoA hydratase/carnithine racemase